MFANTEKTEQLLHTCINRHVILSVQVTARNIMLATTCQVTERWAPGFREWHTKPFLRQVEGRLIDVNPRYALIQWRGEGPELEIRGNGFARIKNWNHHTERIAHIPLTSIVEVKQWRLQ